MSKRFDAKVVLVTGGASGIGLTTAIAFANEGAHVVVADRNAQGAADAANAIKKQGGSAASVEVDVSNPAACVAMVEFAVSHFGGLHVACNNAAIPTTYYADFEDAEIDEWNRVIGINLNGVFYCMKAEATALRKSGGTAIVNTASAASILTLRSQASYVASKHGVAGLTKAAALDLIRHGIRVNAICPGITETGMVAPIMATPEGRASLGSHTPIGRVARPEEMAAAILFLASEQASYMVGSLMVVDGGMVLP